MLFEMPKPNVLRRVVRNMWDDLDPARLELLAFRVSWLEQRRIEHGGCPKRVQKQASSSRPPSESGGSGFFVLPYKDPHRSPQPRNAGHH